jgi:epoxyqueuosine reductase
MITSKLVKRKTMELGADICGIAPTSRFADAPEGFHPEDIYPDCRSVVVFASHFPSSTLQAKTNSPYTLIRNQMAEKLDAISFALADDMEKEKIVAIPIPSSEPYDYWDAEKRHGRGILSLKHAGVLSGLGTMGKNTLLINDKYGNMIWLGAVLVSVELEPDAVASYEGCIPKCMLCIESCPQNALDGTTIDQKRCREHVFSFSEGGECVISCNLCRKVCPNYKGIR